LASPRLKTFYGSRVDKVDPNVNYSMEKQMRKHDIFYWFIKNI
jgi:hypothetical protein